MRQSDLARLLVKIAALVIVVSALLDLPNDVIRFLPSHGRADLLQFAGMTFAPVSITLLAGLAMFWWAGSIVDRVLVADASEAAARPFDSRPFEEIALTVLGAYVTVAGVSECVYYWSKWAFTPDLMTLVGSTSAPMPPLTIGGLLAGAARIAIGLLLVFGSRGLVALKGRILKLRPMHPDA